MGAAVALPMALSIASAGLGAVGKGMEAQGTSTADQFKAQQLDEAATYGELKAQQTNAQLTRNLSISLGNIDAVRAAARADPSSPSGAAVRDYVENTGTTNKNIDVDSITEQARQDEAGAAYMRSASSTALLGGDIGIASSLLSAASPLAKSMASG